MVPGGDTLPRVAIGNDEPHTVTKLPVIVGGFDYEVFQSVSRDVSQAHPKWGSDWGSKPIMKLSARKVQNAPKGTYQDGNGLILVKRDKASGYWKFRFSMDGKRPEMGLGSFPEVSLAGAREAAAEAREQVRAGINPIQARKDAEIARQGVPTLKQCIMDVNDARKAGWKGEGKNARWLSPLTHHVIPEIGHYPITEIDQTMIYDTLKPIWKTKNPTAQKICTRLNITLEYADAKGLDVKLSAVKRAVHLLGESGHEVQHHAAMPWQDVPAYYEALGFGSTVARVLCFMILTGGSGRTAPVRLARYDQIDGDCWTIPGEMMKGRKGKTPDFRVPLSPPALELIELSKELSGDCEWIFPGPSGKPITDVMTSKHMRNTEYTPHGFRTSFREWMLHVGVPYEVAETAIAHSVGTTVTQAYLRDDFFERRKVIMHDWAKHLEGKGSAKLLELPANPQPKH